MPLRTASRPAAHAPACLAEKTGDRARSLGRSLGRKLSLRLSLVAVLASTLLPSLARAAEYETFVDIDDEDDLVELNATGDISAETFDTLVELLRRGVDLNKATRDDLFTLPNLSYADVDALLRYRVEVGFISDPAMLVKAGVLNADTLKSIAAFIYIVEPGRRYAATSGKIRLRTATTVGDKRVPATVLDAQVSTLRHLSLGVAGVLLRDRVSDVRYDPIRGGLSAEAPRPELALPKFFVQWDTDQWAILAGTYRAGFGQRLTFDNTRNYTPNGFYRDLTIYPRPVRLNSLCNEGTGELAESPCQGDYGNSYGTPDFRWQETLQGMAVGLKRLDAGIGWLQAYAFMSVKSKTAYQYQLYDPEICEDPRNDDDPRCSSPAVYKRQPDLLDPTSEFAYQKLPRMYRDTTAGGNVSYFFNRRSWVGVTGYGTDISWQTGGRPLGFQEWARTPFGGPFGAVGVNASWGKRWSDLGIEVTRSFDSMRGASGSDATDARGGGGYGAVLRHTAAWGRHEIETVARYYDRNFANPYARPLAGNDVYEGQRARDEAGARVRYTGRPHKKTIVRAYVNFWVTPSTRTPQIHVLARVEHQVTRWWTPGVWFEGRDKNLGTNGPVHCFGGDLGVAGSIDNGDAEGFDPGEVDVDYSNLEDPNARCPGESVKYNIQSAFFPHRRVKLVPRFQHRFIGDPKSTSLDNPNRYNPEDGPQTEGKTRTGYRQDISAWLTVSARPIDPLRLRGRVRYQNWAIDDNEYLEQSLWSFIDVGYLIKRSFFIQLRYDLYVWLDKRPSTLIRIPSPEHRLMLTLEGRF